MLSLALNDKGQREMQQNSAELDNHDSKIPNSTLVSTHLDGEHHTHTHKSSEMAYHSK